MIFRLLLASLIALAAVQASGQTRVISDPVIVRAVQQANRDFTIVVVPDMQYLASGASPAYASTFTWITNNAKALKIQAVLGLGDIVDGATTAAQWDVAIPAWNKIEAAGIPHLIPPGNHDYDSLTGTRSLTNYNARLPLSRYTSKSWFGGAYGTGSENVWIKLDIGTRKFLLMALEFGPRTNVLDWAKAVCLTNLDRSVIITTHSHIYMGNVRMSSSLFAPGIFNAPSSYYNDATDGENVWQYFLRKVPNVAMILNGHNCWHAVDGGIGAARLSSINDWGNPVMQILSDYQWYGPDQNGEGMIRIYRFKANSSRVEVSTYSPYLATSLTDPDNQFSFDTSIGQPSSFDGKGVTSRAGFDSTGRLVDLGPAVQSGVEDGMLLNFSFSGNSFDSVSGESTTVRNIVYTNGIAGSSIWLVSTSNSLVQVEDTTVAAGMTNLTVAAWVKTTVSAGDIISKHGSQTNGEWALELLSGSIRFFTVNTTPARVNFDANLPYSVSDGAWHFICGTYNSNSMAIYLDGKLIATTNQAGVLNTTAFNVVVGGYRSTTGAPKGTFDGSLDEVRVWNRALSATEISALYNFESGIVASQAGAWTADQNANSQSLTNVNGVQLKAQSTTNLVPGSFQFIPGSTNAPACLMFVATNGVPYYVVLSPENGVYVNTTGQVGIGGYPAAGTNLFVKGALLASSMQCLGNISGYIVAASSVMTSTVFRGANNSQYTNGSPTTPAIIYQATNHIFQGDLSVTGNARFNSIDTTNGITAMAFSGVGMTLTGGAAIDHTQVGASSATPTTSYAADYNGSGLQQISFTGNMAISTVNGAAGKNVTLKLKNTGGTASTLSFTGLTFIGSAAPTTLAAGKNGWLTIVYCSDGTQIAAYAAEP